jgi:hypothetical protein
VHPDSCGAGSLLYISNANASTVNVYNYPFANAAPPCGTVTGFIKPKGECVDSLANVYIVDYTAARIYEYSHSGTLLGVASDSYGKPIGCSINPVTGDLAVSNHVGFSISGGIDIFSGGIFGAETYYTDNITGGLYYMWPPSYDPSGNLYVDGLSATGSFGLAELSGPAFVNIALSGQTIDSPGTVRWYAAGNYLAAGDQSKKIYHVHITTGTVGPDGPTLLTGVTNLRQYFIKAGKVVAPDCSGAGGKFQRGPYPGGFPPVIATIAWAGCPYGSAISP